MTSFTKQVLWWAATASLLGVPTCLSTGCASSLSLGKTSFVVHSMDMKPVDGAPDGMTQPLWRFAFRTSDMGVDWEWDGMAIASKTIDDVAGLIGKIIGGFGTAIGIP